MQGSETIYNGVGKSPKCLTLVVINDKANEDIVHLMNMQNIPSHATDIRHMFRATPEQEKLVSCESNSIVLDAVDDVMTDKGYVCAADVCIGTIIKGDDGDYKVISLAGYSNDIRHRKFRVKRVN